MERTAGGIQVFGYAAAVPKPFMVVSRILTCRKICHGRDELDAIRCYRAGACEVVLCEFAYEPISSEEKGQRLDYCSFANVAGADQNGVAPEPNASLAYTAKVLYPKISYPHRSSSPTPESPRVGAFLTFEIPMGALAPSRTCRHHPSDHPSRVCAHALRLPYF
jgi:hypothetical protein